jgi:lysozyme
MNNQIPASGIDLIKQFEGCKLTAYPDPLTGGAPWTIGWGSTKNINGAPFKEGDKITQPQADTLLEDSILSSYIPSLIRIPYYANMSEEQKGALLSFAYNLGAGFYGNPDFTTISRYLKDKDWDRVPQAMLLYRNPGSNVEEGLKRRRIAEGKLWETGLEKFRKSKRLIIANCDTLLKKEPVQSFELSAKDRVEVRKGKSYTVVDSVDQGSHIRVKLDHGAGTWYIYKPHWDIKVPGTQEESTSGDVILLNVPYFTQLDSRTSHGTRMCFSSTCAMAAEFLKPGCLSPVVDNVDDYYMTKYVFKYGDTTNPNAQVSALGDLGIHAVFKNKLSREDVISQLKKGYPVPVGYLHKGYVSSPTGSGHWCLIVGIDLANKQYIVNDPWGDCDLVHGGMLGSQNGYRVRYSFKNFEPRWMVEGDKTGWGLILVR